MTPEKVTVPFIRGRGLACPGPPSRTLREDAREAGLIVYGRVVPQSEPRASQDSGPDLLIDHVVKRHPALGGRKVLRFPVGRVDAHEDRPQPMVVFVDVSGGQLDPFGPLLDEDGRGGLVGARGPGDVRDG